MGKEGDVGAVEVNPVFEPLSKAKMFLNHFHELKDHAAKAKENKGLFRVMPANKWMEQAKNRPIPKMLFNELWFETELCILFADTNLGKSILAVQIGNSISRGEPIPGFKFEAEKQPVLYFDFELSDKQFENRYSENFENHYIFDKVFLRVEIDPDTEIPEKGGFENFLNQSLEQSIIETGAKILIIDNLTYLKNETERAKDALPLMKYLKSLKSKYGLSILALHQKGTCQSLLQGTIYKAVRCLLIFVIVHLLLVKVFRIKIYAISNKSKPGIQR